MKAFICLLLVSACSASYLGHAVSTQYHAQDSHGGYSYGYADPNAQKHETKSHGVVHGGYSYVDGNGHVQSVKYTADSVHGFQATGTNIPHVPAHHEYAAPVYAHNVPAQNDYHHYGYPALIQYGVPIDTPEVQHAKAVHFAAHSEVNSRLYNGHGHIYKRYAGHYSVAPAPVNGVPVDTAEVAHAKAQHLAAHSRALAETHSYPAHQHGYTPAHYAHAPSHYAQHIPVIRNGVPVETPEVQHAKATHFAAVAKVSAHAHGHGHGYAPVYNHHGYQHNGAPIDTPEVQHAKAAHFAAVAKASAAAHDHGHGFKYNGAPVDTPEVQHAKAVHFEAVAQAKATSYSNSHLNNGHYNDHHEDDGQYREGHHDYHHHY